MIVNSQKQNENVNFIKQKKKKIPSTTCAMCNVYQVCRRMLSSIFGIRVSEWNVIETCGIPYLHRRAISFDICSIENATLTFDWQLLDKRRYALAVHTFSNNEKKNRQLILKSEAFQRQMKHRTWMNGLIWYDENLLFQCNKNMKYIVIFITNIQHSTEILINIYVNFYNKNDIMFHIKDEWASEKITTMKEMLAREWDMSRRI